MVTIVIPAHNEEGTISAVVAGLRRVGYDSVVVVDDGSTDQTAARACAAGAICLRHPMNRGQGAALQTGTTYALRHGADIIVHFDADGQHQPTEVATWIEPIVRGSAEVVFGSRFLAGNTMMPAIKRLVLRALIPWHNLFVGLHLTDIHNGARALSRSVAERLVITQDGMAHNSEIAQQVAALNVRYREVPTTVVYHRYGQSLIGGGLRIIRDLFMSRFT